MRGPRSGTRSEGGVRPTTRRTREGKVAAGGGARADMGDADAGVDASAATLARGDATAATTAAPAGGRRAFRRAGAHGRAARGRGPGRRCGRC